VRRTRPVRERVRKKKRLRTSIEVCGIIFTTNGAPEKTGTVTKVFMFCEDTSVQDVDIGAITGKVTEHELEVV
jgi:hypothetical protein